MSDWVFLTSETVTLQPATPEPPDPSGWVFLTSEVTTIQPPTEPPEPEPSGWVFLTSEIVTIQPSIPPEVPPEGEEPVPPPEEEEGASRWLPLALAGLAVVALSGEEPKPKGRTKRRKK